MIKDYRVPRKSHLTVAALKGWNIGVRLQYLP